MEQDLKLLVRQFKALSNEHRLKLLLQIVAHERAYGREQGCLINEMVADWRICAATISHHIRIMESARVNLDTYEMRMRLFHVRPEAEHMKALLRSRPTDIIETN